MASPRGVHNIEFGPLGDEGKFMSLLIQDTGGKTDTFALPTSALPAMVIKLLRITGHPKIKDNLVGLHSPQAGASNLDFLPYQAIGAGFLEANRNVALVVTFAGGIQFGLALNERAASAFAESLGQARQAAQNPQNSSSLN